MVARVLPTKRFQESADLASRLEDYALETSGEIAKDIQSAATFIRLTLALIEPTLQNIEAALGSRKR
jgi:hypothetical protein